jgi:hypothetical protein
MPRWVMCLPSPVSDSNGRTTMMLLLHTGLRDMRKAHDGSPLRAVCLPGRWEYCDDMKSNRLSLRCAVWLAHSWSPALLAEPLPEPAGVKSISREPRPTPEF